MKKSAKILLWIAAFVLVVFLVFQKRITGTFRVYHLMTAVTEAMDQGSGNFDLRVAAGIGEGEKKDTVYGTFSYAKGEHYYADVTYGGNRYVILHRGDSTEVIVPGEGLLIAGKADTAGCFDMARLAGNILEDYPGTADIPALSWKKRAGLAVYLMMHSGVEKKEKEGRKYLVIKPKDDLVKDAGLWLSADGKSFLVRVGEGKEAITVSATLEEKTLPAPAVNREGLKRLAVDGDELNTAIYRGALRTGGLLLENNKPPQTDGVERRWGKGLLTYVDGNRVLFDGRPLQKPLQLDEVEEGR